MEKLKILYTIPNFDTAGSGKVLLDLAKGLDRERFEVHIACFHSRGVFFKEIETLGIPIHIINFTVSLRPYYNLWFRVNPIVKFLKEHRFDIVHSWHYSSDWTELLAVKRAGVKYVYTKKAMTWGNKHWRIKSYFADFIITINEDMKDYFHYKKAQKLIPLGLDTAYYSIKHFPEMEKSDVFQIIVVANLVPVKNIEVLIEAVCQLDEEVSLTILGDDNSAYAKELKKKVKTLNREEQILFLGKQADIRLFLARSDLFVLPSEKEGMPMALVEAMSMGIPVLGSDIAGINFVLKDFPELLFKPGNVEALADKISMIMRNSKVQNKALGENLRLYCETHFSYKKFIEAHEGLYKQIYEEK